MDDARQLAAVVALHRDDLPPIALGDDPLLGDPATNGVGHRRLHALFKPVLGRPQLPPRAREDITRAVRHFAARGDRAVDLV